MWESWTLSVALTLGSAALPSVASHLPAEFGAPWKPLDAVDGSICDFKMLDTEFLEQL